MAWTKEDANRVSWQGGEVLGLTLLALVALAVRLLPLNEVSFWWDELVHVQTASRDTFAQVLEEVRLGIPPGFGNAGAVPLDYILLHGWLELIPAPPAAWLELYYRTPSLVWSVSAVVALYLYVRRFFDRRLAAVAGTLLALSVPHALYAAEARFYSLFSLMTVVNLWSFSALVFKRDQLRPWLVFTAIAILYFATGLFGLMVLLLQYVILFLLLLSDQFAPGHENVATRRLRPIFPLLSGLVVLAAFALYMQDTFLGAQHGRTGAELDTWDRSISALTFFIDGNPLYAWAAAAGLILLAVRGAQEGRERLAMALLFGASFFALPVIVEIERWKAYYFHPRHAFFLLPTFAILTAGGLLLTLRTLDPLRRLGQRDATRQGIYTALCLVLILTTQITPLQKHLEPPHRSFGRSKNLRDFKSLVAELQGKVAGMEDGQVYLLFVDPRNVGHIGNPMLGKYLEWYELDDRVILRRADRPKQMLSNLETLCHNECYDLPASSIESTLGATAPFSIQQPILDLLEIVPSPPTQAPVGGIGILYYWTFLDAPPRNTPGFTRSRHPGLTLFEKKMSAP